MLNQIHKQQNLMGRRYLFHLLEGAKYDSSPAALTGGSFERANKRSQGRHPRGWLILLRICHVVYNVCHKSRHLQLGQLSKSCLS